MADALNDRLLPAELLSESAPVKIRQLMAEWCKKPPTIREKEKHAHTSARSRFEACLRQMAQIGQWGMGHDGCSGNARLCLRELPSESVPVKIRQIGN